MNKPYRSIDFNDERKWKSTGNPADDVAQVGVHKALGYIVNMDKQYKEKVNDFDEDHDLEALKQQFLQQDKLVDIHRKDGMFDMMHVGDKVMMQAVLDRHQEILRKAKWPCTAEMFFKKIAKEDVDHYKNADLYHVICDLFNSWCLFCEKSIWQPYKKGQIRSAPLSEHPYDPDVDNG